VANSLFDLFNDELKVERDLVATDPHTLENISSLEEEQEFFLEKIAATEQVELKVDYSDFANFVFFNSALDYFNITGEKILNEYPFDGSRDEIEKFKRGLDGYQRYLLNEVWPKNSGHLRFDSSISSSFIKIDDVGREGTVSRGGLLSPGTGSLTIEAWIEPCVLTTGSEEVMVIIEKEDTGAASGINGYGLYITGSQLVFAVKSGSYIDTVSSPVVDGQITYVAAVLDRSSYTGSMSIITGSQTEFPVIVNSASLTFYEKLDISASASFFIGSGSAATLKNSLTTNIIYYSGSLDNVRMWKKARTLNEISSSFNVKHYAQKHLNGLWRFNESGSAYEDENNKIVTDFSGRGLNGRIQNYYPQLRASGTLLNQEDPDFILNIRTPEVAAMILEQQTSGSVYDRGNQNKVTDMFPENFFRLEDFEGTEVLKNFLYVMGRHFDVIKLHIDQFINILRLNYGKYDQTPDALLDVYAKFFGWEFTGNFLNADAFKYITGRGVLTNLDANKDIETDLFNIKNGFWKRVLLNLMYIYKTKGTRESIKALLRCYGVNDNFVRIKEYGVTPYFGIETKRIKADKSEYALGFGSGSLTGSIVTTTPSLSDTATKGWAVEARVKFPTTSSAQIPATELSGALWHLTWGSASLSYYRLEFQRESIGSFTGSLILSSSEITPFALTGVGIFNDQWQTIVVNADALTGSYEISVRTLNEDFIENTFTVLSGGVSSVGIDLVENFTIGTSASYKSEYWMHEVRLWSQDLSDSEIDDHALNFQSYGTDDIFDNDRLNVHWRLRENLTASVDGNILPRIEDVSKFARHGTATGFNPSQNPYKKFLFDYNYIASPDFGWSEDKIRIFDSNEVPRDQIVEDQKTLSVEFNLIDSLNEDIVQLFSSLDSLNEKIGSPVNKHRVSYDELEIVRNIYFNRLQGKLNFTLFADMLDFFDRSFLKMVRKIIPARSQFFGDEFVVESHMLERPKMVYERRKQQETIFAPTGIIEMWSRFGRNDDGSGKKFPLFLTGSVT